MDINTSSNMTINMNNGAPTPPLSPSASMSCLIRPPTHGGGPLSSHPATPIDMPGAWVSTTDLQAQVQGQIRKPDTPPLGPRDSPPSSASPSIIADVETSRQDSFRTPLTPASANGQRRGSKVVRKLLSLSGLRNSFMSSRSSLAASSTSSVSSPNPSNGSENGDGFSERPVSRGTKRTASTSMGMLSAEENQQQPPSPLRKRKSTGWFRRKSQVLLFGDGYALNSPVDSKNGGMTDADSRSQDLQIPTAYPTPELSQVPQDPYRSKARHASRHISAPLLSQTVQSRPHTSLPPQIFYELDAQEPPKTSHTFTFSDTSKPMALPELDSLGGGNFNGGSLDAEDMFTNIGR